MWVFGYGSLIWKVDFPYEESLVGCIRGYCRRFYQHSTDHRGTRENPGRVATILKADLMDEVWGVAYKIAHEDEERVVKDLDFREKGGYQRHNVLFFPLKSQNEPFEITLYLATESNTQYAGEAGLSDIALQVIGANGPSGSNVEYVFNLANAMRQIAPQIYDEHLFGLEDKINEQLERRRIAKLRKEHKNKATEDESAGADDEDLAREFLVPK